MADSIQETIHVKDDQGKDVEAVLIGVVSAAEHWSEYFLEDGSLIKSKVVNLKIFRMKNRYDADGNPLYILRHTVVSAVSSPASIKRPPDHT